MILNEPETSLHPDLLHPLARLIAAAAARSQIIVVSHAAALVEALGKADATQIVLTKELGETVVLAGETPAWSWPAR
jgi:predicted ATPase